MQPLGGAPGETPNGKPRTAPNMLQEVESPSLKQMMDNIKSMLQVLGDVASIQIFVKAKTGETITLNVKETDTIDQVTLLLMNKRSVFSFAGKQLKDGTLRDHNVQKGSIVWESGCGLGGMGKRAHAPAADVTDGEGKIPKADKLAMKAEEIETLVMKIQASRNTTSSALAEEGSAKFAGSRDFAKEQLALLHRSELKLLRDSVDESNGEGLRS